MSSKQELANAETLVEFANLDESGVDVFRAKHSDFAPAPWWTYKKGAQWKMNQRWLREAWDLRFDLGMFRLMRLLESVFDPDNDILPPHPEDAHPQTFVSVSDMRDEFYPYQQAVMFLKDENWRVRVCGCGKRYVADHPRRKYCSIACPLWHDEQEKRAHSEHRKKQKRRWWNKRGKKKRKH
jgi:hypothetical protein